MARTAEPTRAQAADPAAEPSAPPTAARIAARATGPGDGPGDGPSPTRAPASSPGAAEDATATARLARARELVDGARRSAQAVDERRRQERARDEQWVARARQGDVAAFQQLVVAHQGRLFSVAFGILRDRDDALDVVQDAFIKAHRKLADFEGNSAFSTWLYRITVNLCIDRKRSVARRRQTDLDDVVGRNFDDDPLYADADFAPHLSGANPLKNAHNKQLGEHIARGLAQLSADHRAIVLLREVEGMSYDEIASTLDIPRGTVMSRLFHARRNLQRVLRPLLGLQDGSGLDGKPADGGDGGSAGAADDGNEESDVPRRPNAAAPSIPAPEKRS